MRKRGMIYVVSVRLLPKSGLECKPATTNQDV